HVRHRHEIVRPEEEVELGGVQALDRLVVRGKVEDPEEVPLVRVVVDLRALPLREDVLDVERVPAETGAQLVDDLRLERLEVDPGQALAAELSDAWFRARCDRLCEAARPRPQDAGQAWHRYSGGRRSSAPCRHWPSANTPTAAPKTIAAWVPVSHLPAAVTATNAPTQMTPTSARPRKRRRPSTSFTIGS